MAFAGGGDQLLVWDSSLSALRVFDTQTWNQVATISMPATYSSNNGERWGDLSVGDNGAFVYVGGQMASIDLAAQGLTELTASAPSAGLIEAGVNPDGSATAGVSTSTIDLAPSGGTAALTYATAGWSSQGSGLYSRAATYGSVVLDTVDNTLTYTLDNNAAATLALGIGVTATESFTVEVGDGTSNASALVSFSVTGTDVDPTVIGHSRLAVNTKASVESAAALLAGAADAKGQPLHVVNVRNATHGVVSLDAQGDAVFTPDAGYVGQASYDYSVSDGMGGAATGTVQVTVLAPASLTASAPSAALVEAGVTPSGEATSGVATSTVGLTPSGGDAPTYVLTGWTGLGAGLYSQTGTYGSAVLDTIHDTLSYTLNNSAPATLALGVGVTASDTFTVAIADELTTASVPVSFSVTGTDVDPTVIGHSLTTVDTRAWVESSAALLAGAGDVKGEPLHVSAVGDATHGSVVLDAQGDAVFTPAAGYIGPASYSYTVSDGHGGTASGTVQVSVVPDAKPDDFDGDGTADVMFRQASTGDWGYMTAGAYGGEAWHSVGPSSTDYAVIAKGDFNGDGRGDIAFRDTSTGDWGYMSLDASGAEVWHGAGPSSLAYEALGAGDFNGDGQVDVAFRNTTTGDWGFMTPGAYGGETWHDVGSTTTSYAAVGIGDFDGAGRDEIAFRDPTTGDFGYMSVTASGTEAWHAIGPTSPDYVAVGCGDFNGDGLLDVAFRQAATGDWGFMTINPGGGETWHAVGPSSTDYAVIGAADYDGDGRTDLAFRNKAGDWGFMSVNGAGQEVWRGAGTTSTDYAAL